MGGTGRGRRPRRRTAPPSRAPKVAKTSPGSYAVISQASGRRYRVSRTNGHGWSCTCPHYKGKGTYCRHIRAAEDVTGIRKLKGGRRVAIGRVDAAVCRKGCAQGVIKKGRRRRAGDMVQQYACKACGSRFTANLGLERMRTPPLIIGAAINMYLNGESYRDVAETLGMLGYPVTHKAVMKWVAKYVPAIKAYLDSLRPRLSGRWRTDEMQLTVGGKKMYLYALIDDESRFWIAVQLAPTKNTANIRPLMKRGMRLAGRNPEVLTSDGGPNIAKACNDVFRAPGLRRKTIHESHIHLAGDRNNNKMESFNGGVRDREKVMRSIKRRDSAVIDGMRIHHNTRPHTGLGGKSPYDRMGIIIEGDNKWVTLIQNAAMARVESKTKKMRQNASKNCRNSRKAQKVKKVQKGRSR